MTTTRKFILYWLPVGVWCGVIFMQSAFPSPESVPRFPFSDKLLHMLAYGLLAFLICRAVFTFERWQLSGARLFWIGVISASLYGLSDEWHQSFVAGRTAEAADFLADFVGSAFGSAVYSAVRRHRRID